MSIFEKSTKHPAYGMVQFSRVTGSPQVLFGSSIQPQSWIELTIRRGEVNHDLGKDWFFGHGEIISVQLSPAQFAELLTSMNVGTGVPCTIEHVNGEKMPRLTMEDIPKEAASIINHMREKGQEITKHFQRFEDKMKQLVGEKKISKKMADEIEGTFFKLKQDLQSNLPFYLDQLNKSSEKIVVAKKAEVDAFVSTIITRMGLEKLDEVKKMIE